MTEYVCRQDGKIAEDKIIDEFELNPREKEIIFDEDNLLYDFVGFVYKDDKILVVFPKHYMDDVKEITNDDIELLFKVMKKYNSSQNNANAEKYYGYKNNFESDYPFEAFYKIYDYYIKYGLYRNYMTKEKANDSSKISWKTTIRKSKIVVSDYNLLYLPLYSKSKEEKHTFIGECMTYIINHTIDLFPFIGNFKRVNEMLNTIDIIKNRESVLKELYVYRSKVFKDSEKELINAIIQYLKEIKDISNGGSIHIKIKYFMHIWERMINKYLDEYFDHIEDKELIFSEKKINRYSFLKKDEAIDLRPIEKNRIQPDFYFEDDNVMYVFDAKYYEKMDGIEYKQVAYTFLLGNRESKGTKEIYSALILPGSTRNDLNLSLKEEYRQQKDGCNYIMEQYMDVKKMMKNYINSK